MSEKIRFKRGDTFSLFCSVEDDITGWQIASQVRHGDSFVVNLDVEIVDAEAGSYRLVCADTTDWPARQLSWDIEYTLPDGLIRSTDTILIDCQADVTR